MELLTRNNFEGWMQKLMERLDRQDELLLAMKAEGKQPSKLFRVSSSMTYVLLPFGLPPVRSVWLWNRVSIVPSSFLTVLSSNSRSISERR